MKVHVNRLFLGIFGLLVKSDLRVGTRERRTHENAGLSDEASRSLWRRGEVGERRQRRQRQQCR